METKSEINLKPFMSAESAAVNIKERNDYLYPLYKDAVKSRNGGKFLREVVKQLGGVEHSWRIMLIKHGQKITQSVNSNN